MSSTAWTMSLEDRKRLIEAAFEGNDENYSQLLILDELTYTLGLYSEKRNVQSLLQVSCGCCFDGRGWQYYQGGQHRKCLLRCVLIRFALNHCSFFFRGNYLCREDRPCQSDRKYPRIVLLFPLIILSFSERRGQVVCSTCSHKVGLTLDCSSSTLPLNVVF